MEQETRNKLQRATQQIRRLLEEEFAEQLEGTFDILVSGKILPSAGKHLDARQQLIRQKLVKAIEHMQVSGKKPQEAVQAYMREAAFTFLNRFVALRMMEARRLVQECVSRGDQSSGFKEFCGLAPGLAVLPDGGYRLYLECLCDELSVEIKVLFNRRDSASLLWPRRSALTGVLEILAQNELTAIWEDNATIGWVYQYYNDEAERKKMREESSAPRNSRELAVRNQFFTPRYVVQFLTDNTLGRIWYEMTRGETALREHCLYLVRRPTEIFLADPEVTYDHIFGEPEDGEYYGIPSGCYGDFSDLPDDGPDSRWISVALPPGEFPAITGEPYQPFEDDRLGQLINDIIEERDNPDATSLPLVWAAVSCFTLNDGGGAYSIGPWKKLWAHFCRVAQQPTPRNLSQEELLKQPVFIPHRPLKDPREIRLLDPACGSMHFGLYAFEIFSIIYEEAWEIAHGPDTAAKAAETFAKFVTFAATFANKALFLRDVPRLIIEHNIHGIDIDPRAAQIANLAIWLRAQRSWNESGIDRKDRPQISRSNIVCAEPMPGEKAAMGVHQKEYNRGSARTASGSV